MKILHAPTSTGGNAFGLSRAERELGCLSDVMVYSSDWLKYPVDYDLHFEKLNRLEREVSRLKFLSDAFQTYDTYNFNFGETLLSYPRLNLYNVDLPLLKILGKKIVFVFQGCDMRLKEYGKSLPYSACKDCSTGICTEKSDEFKKKQFIKFLKYSKHIYSVNPDLCSQYKGVSFIPYTSVDYRKWVPSEKAHSGKIKILHAPTNRTVKGTEYILKAIEKLKSKRSDIEFILIENMPYEEAKLHYLDADIVIDQLLVGWYGAFAVEMMALKKPVVCYIREEDLKHIPEGMKKDLPVFNANIDNILEKLEFLCENEKLRDSLGEKGRKYVETWHDPVKIAQIFIGAYNS